MTRLPSLAIPALRTRIRRPSWLSPRGRSRRGHAIATLVVSLLAIIGVELLARTAYRHRAVVTDYCTRAAAVQYEFYRQEARAGRTPEVVVVGDSTGHRGINPLVLEKHLPGVRAYNLAYPANFARAFHTFTLPVLREPNAPPRLVVVSMTPGSFGDFKGGPLTLENQILDTPICQRELGSTDLTAWCYLPRLGKVVNARATRAAFKLGPPQRGYEPYLGRNGPDPFPPADPEPDQPLDLIPPTGKLVSGCQEFFCPLRLRMLQDLVDTASRRGFKLLFINPCNHRGLINASQRMMCAEYLRVLSRHQQQSGVDVIDAFEWAGVGSEDFWDYGHLNEQGAAKFSAALAPRIAEILARPTP